MAGAPLSKELRNQLARVTLAARQRAESAARAALEHLAVHEREPRGHMSPDQRRLRNRLRVHGRALGDTRDERSGVQEIRRLTEEAAYEHWHRLLFTRFLAENHLLLMPDEGGGEPTPVTIEECNELAAEMDARDGFDLACRFAARCLPGVFRTDDPVLNLPLSVGDQVELRKLLESLTSDVFTATDALGWTYQFWQAQRNEEINESEAPRGADEIPAATQFFTEDYMVDFLLDNTLGAWWAGKVLAGDTKLLEATTTEAELRRAVAVPGCAWTYLRFVRTNQGSWRPAAGLFEDWPAHVSALKAIDPCMGSGHFIVAIFERLVGLRVAQERRDLKDTVRAVIRDNLFGLEIDPRCTQIAAFNLALAAWRLVGHASLPPMNLACSGIAPNSRVGDWVAMAGPDQKLQRGMERLHGLFQQASVLGSLINPRADGGDLLVAGFHELEPVLEKALSHEADDDAEREMAVAARGLTKAAEILASQFTLVATNVPYLGRGKQDAVLQEYCEKHFPASKADLATCFVERCVGFCSSHGTTALVTPQNWWFLGSYRAVRERLLTNQSVSLSATLGEEAWQSFGDRGPSAVLIVIHKDRPGPETHMAALHAAPRGTIRDKIAELEAGEIREIAQERLYNSKDHLITITEPAKGTLLSAFADCIQGVGSTDMPRFIQFFWEQRAVAADWDFYHMAPTQPGFSNLCGILFWEQGQGALAKIGTARKGLNAFGKRGVAVAVTRYLTVSHFLGNRFDCTLAVLIPKKKEDLAAIVAYVFSEDFREQVRRVDQAVSVTESSFIKVPFDLEHWNKAAAEKYPNGLPKPFSKDPAQWLFDGHPAGADQVLHVAVARLLGYKWPRQTGSTFPDCPNIACDDLERFADDDGVVCLPALNREQTAATRLRSIVSAAVGQYDERVLIAASGSNKSSFEEWLRDDFFLQHCDIFRQRPFIWHIWDGLKDGFHALVNYHRLDNPTLQKLTYTYLGDWIRQQNEEAKADKPGAAGRLTAARALQQDLTNILEGEAPYDIFVRWKPLAKQPVGWYPDLNDGVRMNIRPLVIARDVGKKGAGILRSRPNIKWTKDKGTEPERSREAFPWFWCADEPDTDPKGGSRFVGARWNNVHLSLAVKRAAKNS